MSMDLDIENTDWRCGCQHTNPDFDEKCNGCGEERYPVEKAPKVLDLMQALKDSLKQRTEST